MDLNYLYHRRGVSLLRASSAQCDASRAAHRSLAKGYSARIADAHRGMAASKAANS